MICAQRGKLYVDVFFLRQYLSYFCYKRLQQCIVVAFMVML